MLVWLLLDDKRSLSCHCEIIIERCGCRGESTSQTKNKTNLSPFTSPDRVDEVATRVALMCIVESTLCTTFVSLYYCYDH